MEIVYDDLVNQELLLVDNVQMKLEHKSELPENAKKVMGVNCQILSQNAVVQDNEITLTGNLTMRLIFINEFDKYDSKDINEPFEKKVAVKDLTAVNSVFATMQITDSQWSVADNAVLVSNIIDVIIKGVKEQETRLVCDLTGEVEVRKTEHKILAFNTTLNDKFAVDENLELESNCEGILGVDANALIKDVACSDGKVTIKGLVVVNVIGVKTVDNGSVPYNFTHEIEFAKSIVVTGTTSEDLATGTVAVNGVTMHIENGNKGSMLVLQIELVFNGCAYLVKKFNTLVDAISFDKELTFETSQLEYADVLPQVNTTVDIESNINLPGNMPYIARVLAVDGIKINHLQVTAADGKTMVEGLLIANVLVENEEHLTSNYLAEIPFQTHVRMDNLDGEHQVSADVIPLNLNVKARRGVELLIDVKLGVCIRASNHKSITVATAVVVGKDKVEDGSAIRIYIIGEKETLWDLAKRTNLSCAELLKQNPNLDNGCVPGERIVVYRHEAVEL